VGATGSGKSTTLAAMLDYRNDTKPGHIVTVEDPIEFIHEHKKCLVTQREIGIDTESYQAALKNALRQRPDTILIGEIRDAEVMEHAIVFAETGHLCMATLHANNANQALERILNFFPESRHPQVCLNLAYNLRAVIAQRLVQGEPEGRIPALEILNNDGLVRELIRTNQHDKIKEAMERSSASGSQTFDQALFNLVAQRAISESTALSEADCVADLELKLRQSRIGGQVDGLAGLDTSQISFL
ncbi:MAG: ATPase, T2SS/T4P/T4SS family, partial [Rhodospirillaceae bacterium]